MSKLIKIALGAAMAAFVAFPAWADDLGITVVDCGPASDSALAWPVPDVVAARSTSSNGNSCLLGRRCADVRSDVAVPGR